MHTNVYQLAGRGFHSLRHMSAKQRFGTVMLGIVGSLMVAVTAFTGTARASLYDCYNPYGTIACFWFDNNYSGLRADYYNPGSGYCYNVSSTFNDQISSIYNATPYRLDVFPDAGCQGWGTTVNAWNYTPSLGWFMNDEASSFSFQ